MQLTIVFWEFFPQKLKMKDLINELLWKKFSVLPVGIFFRVTKFQGELNVKLTPSHACGLGHNEGLGISSVDGGVRCRHVPGRQNNSGGKYNVSLFKKNFEKATDKKKDILHPESIESYLTALSPNYFKNKWSYAVA
ncbi:unnamed protein product [Rodentolepis nana]|uniref:Uncharacterized protein n=1 Tax=Rodentolepis nana TaxID=102285 RepID=A0A0R3TSM8_RODNA|nr:unnamed protein product [Rodentolepis nana]